MKNGCCIIETRVFGNLQEIIQQKHLNFIPRSWGLTLFLSEANQHLIHAGMFDREVQIFILPDSLNEYQYNHLLTRPDFWIKLPYKRVLIFQTDSEILREGIEEFLPWGYVGAAWSWQDRGGNGGLSLRDPQLMKRICDAHQWNPQLGSEDVFFCNIMAKIPTAKLAPREVCERFSVEAVYSLGSFGVHAFEKYLSPEQIMNIKMQYK